MLDILRAAAPYLTIALTIICGLIAWIVTRLAEKVDDLAGKRMDDERYLQERYVKQEDFYREVGSNKKVLDQIFARVNEISASMNQMMGENRAYENFRKELSKHGKGSAQ